MGTPYDFYSPFFRAAIILNPDNPEKTRYPLWVLNDKNANPSSALDRSNLNDLKSLAFCTDITVKFGLSYVPTLTATLTPPFEDGRKFLSSPLVEWTRSHLEVEFGYTNGPQVVLSPKFVGRIQKPDVNVGTEMTITLPAQGVGGDLASRGESDVRFEKKSRLDIMRELLKPYKIDVDDAKVKGEAKTKLDEKLESYFGNNLTAYFNATELARVCGCWAVLKDFKFTLYPVNDAVSGTPAFKFRLFDYPGGQIGPVNGVFPVLGFSTPTTAVFLSGATRQLRLHSYDSKTREIKTEKVITDASAAPSKTSQGQAAAPNDAMKGDFYPGNVADPAEEAKALELYKAEQYGGMGVRIEVDSLGIPDLAPGGLVEVKGIAPVRLDGNYAVFSVEHNVGTSGFTTKFTGISNVGQFIALPGGDDKGEFEDAKGTNKNTKDEKAPQATSSSTVTIEAKAQ